MKHKVGLLVLAGMLFTVSSAFAAVQYYTLKNDKGEVLYQEKHGHLPSSVYSEEEMKRVHIMNEVWTKVLKPGEAAAIYVVPNNPDHELYIKSTPHQVKKMVDVRKMVHDPDLVIPDVLAGRYKFASASIHMNSKTDIKPLTPKQEADIAEQLRKKAIASQKDYAIMPIEFTDTFWKADITYKQGNKEITLTFMNLGKEGSMTFYRGEQQTSNKVKINNIDVIQTLRNNGSSDELTWVKELPNGQRYGYFLRPGLGDISEKEFMEIAKSYIKN